MKVDILGTEYEIVKNAEEKDYPMLKDADGYADFTIRKIVIKKLIQDGECYEDLELWQRKTLRHEIVHAFLYESGLWQNSFKDWARNEEMTDWIALQFEKMLKVFIEVKAIKNNDITVEFDLNKETIATAMINALRECEQKYTDTLVGGSG